MRKRLALLDRDGVLNVDTGYVHRADQWQWIAGAPQAVADLMRSGCTVVVVTNQSGIARGMYSEEQLQELHDWVNEELQSYGAEIARFYYCPHLPQAPISDYDCICSCRKPAPGMICAALRDAGCEPAEAFLIGDSARDLEAAARAGVESFLFSGGNLHEFVQKIMGRGESR